ncbi:hypothetical protein CTAYLR_005611 [Chrysophaeum taylorii]|uniref:Redoxin domain-containing protein n=1 Tax=Chrysophaeum taylorii TaxID=2483200 RepID=A0AAD7U7T7_9STRA|nr:hypothetical protein CTAYLR_005611 [Chrysophaeum taylorii]
MLLVSAVRAFAPAARGAQHLTRRFISIGDAAPAVRVVTEFPLTTKDFSKMVEGKKNVPDFLEKQDILKEAGIDEVLVYCVNDMAVMEAWAKDQGIEGSMVSFFADPTSALTKALDMEMTAEGPAMVLGAGRSKRFTVFFDDGVAKAIGLAESEDDPAGDADPEDTLVDAMLEKMKVAA